MKAKILSSLTLILIAVLMASPVSLRAQNTNEAMSVGIVPTISVLQATTQSTLSIIANFNQPTIGIQFSLSYDPDLIQVESVVEGDFYSSWTQSQGGYTWFQPGTIDNKTGLISNCMVAVIGGKVGATGKGTIISIKVTPTPGNAGSSDVLLSDVIVVNKDGKYLPGVITNSAAIQSTAGSKPISHKMLKPTNYQSDAAAGVIRDLNLPKPSFASLPAQTQALTIQNTIGSLQIPSGNLAWGLDIFERSDVFGFSAAQRYSTTLNLGQQGDFLYAPTMHGVNSCPLEMVTEYDNGIFGAGIHRNVYIYDFAAPPGHEWNAGQSFDQTFVNTYGTLGANQGVPVSAETNHYQFEVYYNFDMGGWEYALRGDTNGWNLMYSEPSSLQTTFGWDQWEYPSNYQFTDVLPPIKSLGVQFLTDPYNWTWTLGNANYTVVIPPNQNNPVPTTRYNGFYGLDGWFFDFPDVTRDGYINVLDLIAVGNHVGEHGVPGWIPEDVKIDGSIDLLDLITVGNHSGQN